MENFEGYYTVDEFSKELRMHRNTILRRIKSGLIQALNLGTDKRACYRIPISEKERICLFNLERIIEKKVEEKLKGEKNE